LEIVLNSIALEPNRWTQDKVPYFRLENLIEPIAAAGFRSVEIWQNHAVLLEPAELRDLRGRADEAGVTFPILGMYPQFHLEGEERDAELRGWDAMADTMRALGASVLKVMPGHVASADMGPDVWDRSVEFVREVLDRTAELAPVIPLETHAGTLGDDAEALLRFFRDVGSDRLKVCLQPLDFTSTEDTIAFYDALAPHVMHLHLQGRKGNEMCMLEDAEMDYGRLLAHAFEMGFSGYLSIEFVCGCVVDSPEQFDLDLVLENARRDRGFIESVPGFTAG